MQREAVHELVDRVGAVVDDCADRGVLERAVADNRRLASWCEANEVRLARLLAKVASFPEKAVADAAGVDLREGVKISERAAVVEAAPVLGDVLAAGEVTGAHVDIVGHALRDLEPGLRVLLLAEMDTLVAAAAAMTPD